MTTLFVLICLMLATVLTVGVGDRIGLPWPVVLLLVTTAVMFVPGTPTVEVDPELILPLFLPPLLWALARRTSWGMFRDQWRTILSLSVGLVFITVAVVTGITLLLIPGVGLVAALALAAAVAPPDPVAVEAVAEPAGIPRRIIGSLQSEGLFNDAASLVIFSAAITAAAFHDDIHWIEAGGTFVYAALGAVLLGWLVGRLSAVVLDWLDSPVAGNAFTWVLPFLVYLGAEEIHVSGVIAVVVAAVELTSRIDATAADARLTGSAFWEVTELLITGLAFGLMGMNVRDAVIDDSTDHLNPLWWGLVISVALIAVRFVWMASLLRRNRTKKGTLPRSRTLHRRDPADLVRDARSGDLRPGAVTAPGGFPDARGVHHRGFRRAAVHHGDPGTDAAGADFLSASAPRSTGPRRQAHRAGARRGL